ncbi:MAG: enoyl-CoA hydratase-related protein [Actinomycetota bacterium]|nr:enoyl-CoA hydratase-related protein [Actinomycetota bacterium]
MSVRVERELQPSGGEVAVVTLDDPGRRNILSPEMVESLVGATAELARDTSVAAVVVTGAGPAFCGGAPLSSLVDASGQARDGGGAEAALRSIYAAFEAVARLPMPTIAAVNGPAVGAGTNLALACDVRVAARSARFDSRFLALGLHPGGAHTWALSRLAGPSAARAMVLLGEVVGGDEAERIGLVWRSVDDDELLGHALELARRAASVPAALLRRAKETFARTEPVATRAEATDVELEAQLWSLADPGLSALLSEAARARAHRPPPGTAGT